jgi:hypothetical protein
MEDQYSITFSGSEALVLFDLLSRFSDERQLTIADDAESRVLWDIHAQLERVLVQPFMPDYRQQVERARRQVSPR